MVDFLELEAQAALTLDAGVLSVYADALLERGDLRGEIIALELSGKRNGKGDDERRENLLNRWLGDRRPSGRIASGFLEIDVSESSLEDEFQHWLHPSTAPYVRAIKVTGSWQAMFATFEHIAQCALPVLCELSLLGTNSDSQDRLQRRPGAHPLNGIDLDNFIRMTPRLSTISLTGSALLGRSATRFSHPSAISLSVTGYRCLSLGECPNLTSLDLAIHHVADVSHTTPPDSLLAQSLVDRRWMPALASLDLSRNGPGIGGPFELGGAVNVVKLVSYLPVMSQLRRLRLPRFRSKDDVGSLQMVLNRMPYLETLEFVRLPTDQRPLIVRLEHPRARIYASEG